MASDQRFEALQQANEVRKAAMDLKREVKDGKMLASVALLDSRAGSVKASSLVQQLPQFGRHRAQRLLWKARIRNTEKRIDELGPTERRALVALLQELERAGQGS